MLALSSHLAKTRLCSVDFDHPEVKSYPQERSEEVVNVRGAKESRWKVIVSRCIARYAGQTLYYTYYIYTYIHTYQRIFLLFGICELPEHSIDENLCSF